MNLTTYISEALRTAKPLATKDALIHGALGLLTESAEYAETIVCHWDAGLHAGGTVIEELGDGAWFAVYTANAAGVSLANDTVLSYNAPARPLTHAITALRYNVAAGKVGTRIKAFVVYNKPIDADALRSELSDVVRALIDCCKANRVVFGDVLAQNIAKLKLRYPDAYSDAAAITRADKE